MKKLLTICLTLAPCALMAATNKISMVTYFPVPYVAYSHVNADQIDVGLTTSACSMKLGCEESQSPLVTPKVNVQSGTLELNGGLGILGNSITLGSGNTGTGHLSFSNVRIATGNMESVNANTMAVTNLNLFGRAFPSCKDANSESIGQMSWQSLTLQGASNQELYLVCAEGSEPVASGAWKASYANVYVQAHCLNQYLRYSFNEPEERILNLLNDTNMTVHNQSCYHTSDVSGPDTTLVIDKDLSTYEVAPVCPSSNGDALCNANCSDGLSCSFHCLIEPSCTNELEQAVACTCISKAYYECSYDSCSASKGAPACKGHRDREKEHTLLYGLTGTARLLSCERV